LQREIAAVTVIVTHDPDEAALLADEVLVIEQGRVLQAGPVDTVFQQPATLRVAELLGLHNVGTGIVRAAGEIETASGLILASTDRALATGTRVMWRVSPRALRVTDDGTHVGVIGGGSLRHGDRYVSVEVGGESFDLAGEDAPRRIDGTLRVAIDPAGVSMWPLGV
jgi:molybdate transport system permease protein